MKLADHISWDRVPPDDPLPHLLLEPRMLNLTAMDGLLGRIVDIERALPKRTYNSEGTLTFEIQDDLCPWNNGRWQLETAGNQNRIRETTDNPDVTMPISTLAMLLFGQISATEAARMGRLDVRDTGALCTWDHVMHTKYRPFCADLF
jgi:predicted acetyltransferase